EGDIPYWRQVMIDVRPMIADLKRVLYVDFEVDPRLGIERARAGDARILCIGAVDSEGREFWLSGEESAIITDFLELANRYEVISGWNLERFDLPVLFERARRCKIAIDELRLPYIDALFRYRQMAGKGIESYSLDTTAE